MAAEKRGLLGYYRQFEGLSEEEVNADLREAAAERRAKELARVEPLDLSRTTWPEYPPPAIVNAITFAARRGLHRYLDRSSGELRSELAHRHGVAEGRLVVGDGVAQLISEAAAALLEADDELVTPWPSYPLYPGRRPPRARRRGAGRRVRRRRRPGRGQRPHAAGRAVQPERPDGRAVVAWASCGGCWRGCPSASSSCSTRRCATSSTPSRVDATLALLEDFPRLLIFRTFSKAWGLAGLRCGYALGGPGAEPLLEQLAPELGVNELAQAGALEAIRTAGAHAGAPPRGDRRAAHRADRGAEGARRRRAGVAGQHPVVARAGAARRERPRDEAGARGDRRADRQRRRRAGPGPR